MPAHFRYVIRTIPTYNSYEKFVLFVPAHSRCVPFVLFVPALFKANVRVLGFFQVGEIIDEKTKEERLTAWALGRYKREKNSISNDYTPP